MHVFNLIDTAGLPGISSGQGNRARSDAVETVAVVINALGRASRADDAPGWMDWGAAAQTLCRMIVINKIDMEKPEFFRPCLAPGAGRSFGAEWPADQFGPPSEAPA